MGTGPQLEDGFTRIANELLEAFCRTRFAGQERQVLDVVLRLTYGFGKKSDQISYGQISKMTLIPRTKVIPLVKSLVLKMVLGSTNNGTRKPPNIWINKHYDDWLPSPKKGTSPNNRTIPSPNNRTIPSPNNGSLPSPIIGTHQRKYTKEKKETYIAVASVFLPDWINPETWASFKEIREAKDKPLTKGAVEQIVRKLEKFKDEGHDPDELLCTAIEHGWLSVYPPKKNKPDEENYFDE